MVSREGFIDWAWSSKRAFKAGAFFKTRSNTIEIPAASLAANADIAHDRSGIELPGQVWFPHADKRMTLTEMKVFSDQYDCVFTILKLPPLGNGAAPMGEEVKLGFTERYAGSTLGIVTHCRKRSCFAEKHNNDAILNPAIPNFYARYRHAYRKSTL